MPRGGGRGIKRKRTATTVLSDSHDSQPSTSSATNSQPSTSVQMDLNFHIVSVENS